MVEIEHWLLKLLEIDGGDASLILRHYEVDEGRLVGEINRLLDRNKTGNSRPPALSPDIVDWMKQAWLLGSVEYSAARIRSGHLLVALLTDENLSRRARDMSGQFARIPGDVLARDFAAITSGGSEAAGPEPKPAARPVPPGHPPARPAPPHWINTPSISRPRRAPGKSIPSWAVTPKSVR